MFKRGEFQESYTMSLKSLELFPEHEDSRELIKGLKRHFSIMWKEKRRYGMQKNYEFYK